MRYVKVPVEFQPIYPLDGSRMAYLACRCTDPDDGEVIDGSVVGHGPTEDEAFADLLRKLGYEEAR